MIALIAYVVRVSEEAIVHLISNICQCGTAYTMNELNKTKKLMSDILVIEESTLWWCTDILVAEECTLWWCKTFLVVEESTLQWWKDISVAEESTLQWHKTLQ